MRVLGKEETEDRIPEEVPLELELLWFLISLLSRETPLLVNYPSRNCVYLYGNVGDSSGLRGQCYRWLTCLTMASTMTTKIC
mmetsp:Transcript_42385/g.51402  ORF Transcript_42385/g.51402 Transcript_42385/m.51402 type:complete len:82 (+) Transcript_42385:364-609(+)